MRAYYFRWYWPSKLVFVFRCVTYIPNLRKIEQKLRSLSWTIGISDRRTDGQTYIQAILYPSIATHLHWTDNNFVSHVTTA